MIARTDEHAVPVPPMSRVDFERPLVSILGLPFDAVDLANAVEQIRGAAFSGRRCFVSTPNLNFAIAARTDKAFRGSVLRSDLSLVDGMYLVWIAKLLGLPVHERVSGADLFEALQAHSGPALDVYLFGGPPNASARAAEVINRRGGGLRCVGFDAPGFGSVESMSSEEQIARINRSGAHFVAVFLGASKGQAWIEHNASRLTAPVLSHLGAVVNFTAGTVRRAPRWMHVSGLEWLWRIGQEPALWRRYFGDGVAVLSLLVTRVLPDAIDGLRWRVSGRTPSSPSQLELERTATDGRALRLVGDWRCQERLPALRAALALCAAEGTQLRINVAGVTAIDSAFTALLLVARGWFEQHGGFEIVGATPRLIEVLRRKLASDALIGTDT